MQELEEEYSEMKGEWKEIGQGLEETTKAVSDELASVDRDAREALDEATASTEEPSKPVPPSP